MCTRRTDGSLSHQAARRTLHFPRPTTIDACPHKCTKFRALSTPKCGAPLGFHPRPDRGYPPLDPDQRALDQYCFVCFAPETKGLCRQLPPVTCLVWPRSGQTNATVKGPLPLARVPGCGAPGGSGRSPVNAGEAQSMPVNATRQAFAESRSHETQAERDAAIANDKPWSAFDHPE